LDREAQLRALKEDARLEAPVLLGGCGVARSVEGLLRPREISALEEASAEVEQRAAAVEAVGRERSSALEQGDGGRHVPAGGCPAPGCGEQLLRADGELPASLVERPELDTVSDSLFELVADELIQLGVLPRQPAGARLMQLRPDLLRHRAVRGLVDQGVAKAECVFAGEGCAVG